MRPSIIEVDLNILKNNLRLIRQHIDDRPVMAVVKSNAYGHGLVRVANLYEQLGVNSLGVALPEEGILLRKSGISLPIAVFCGLLKEQIPELIEWDLEFFVPSTDVINFTEKFCKAKNCRATIHLKIDSGMGRIGTIAENSESLIVSALESENINIKAVIIKVAYIIPLSPNNPIKILVASAEARIFTILFPKSSMPIIFSLDFINSLALLYLELLFSLH